jgi:hypothetical protein
LVEQEPKDGEVKEAKEFVENPKLSAEKLKNLDESSEIV